MGLTADHEEHAYAPLLGADDETLNPAATIPVPQSRKTCRKYLWPWLLVCLAALAVAAATFSKPACHPTPHARLAASDASTALHSLLGAGTVHVVQGGAGSAEQVLATVGPTSSALLLATTGPHTPSRCEVGQPFLTTGPEIQGLPVAAINRAADLLQTGLGRPLYPLHLRAVDFTRHLGPAAHSWMRPVVVWEVGAGQLLVDEAVVAKLWQQPQVSHMTQSLFEKLVYHLTQALPQVTSSWLAQHSAPTSDQATTATSGQSSSSRLQHLLAPAAATAVAAAFAAAPPLWFCVACPVVLGLLAPLLINIGLNQLAGQLCTNMDLPDDQCFDLLLGALGLGFVLALASAIPIFYSCQLYACAHRTDNSTAASKQGQRWAGGRRAVVLQ
ncbi:hypothetical protein V8C86DRAFT_2549522 [Haematococcus lacustris]